MTTLEELRVLVDTRRLVGEPWTELAACRGQTHLFFAQFNERPRRAMLREAAAKRICEHCSVLEPCRAWARQHCEQGIWGGETEEERRRLRRQA